MKVPLENQWINIIQNTMSLMTQNNQFFILMIAFPPTSNPKVGEKIFFSSSLALFLDAFFLQRRNGTSFPKSVGVLAANQSTGKERSQADELAVVMC